MQGQQLLARRQAVLDRLTEAQDEVPQVEGSEELRLEPDHQQGHQGTAEHGGAPEGEDVSAELAPGAAGPAEGRLDFLA